MRAYALSATCQSCGHRWVQYVPEEELLHMEVEAAKTEPDWEGDYSSTCPRCMEPYANQFDMRHIFESLREVTDEEAAAARDPKRADDETYVAYDWPSHEIHCERCGASNALGDVKCRGCNHTINWGISGLTIYNATTQGYIHPDAPTSPSGSRPMSFDNRVPAMPSASVSDIQKRRSRSGLKKLGIGFAVVLAVLVFGLRGCGLHEGDSTVTFTIRGSGSSADLRNDASKVAKAVDACDAKLGLVGTVVGIGGPKAATVTVKKRSSGETSRFVYTCDTGNIHPVK